MDDSGEDLQRRVSDGETIHFREPRVITLGMTIFSLALFLFGALWTVAYFLPGPGMDFSPVPIILGFFGFVGFIAWLCPGGVTVTKSGIRRMGKAPSKAIPWIDATLALRRNQLEIGSRAGAEPIVVAGSYENFQSLVQLAGRLAPPDAWSARPAMPRPAHFQPKSTVAFQSDLFDLRPPPDDKLETHPNGKDVGEFFVRELEKRGANPDRDLDVEHAMWYTHCYLGKDMYLLRFHLMPLGKTDHWMIDLDKPKGCLVGLFGRRTQIDDLKQIRDLVQAVIESEPRIRHFQWFTTDELGWAYAERDEALDLHDETR